MKAIYVCLLSCSFISSCIKEDEIQYPVYEVAVTEKGSNMRLGGALVSLARCPYLIGDCVPEMSKRTNGAGNVSFTYSLAGSPALMVRHSDYWPYTQYSSNEGLNEVQLWPFACLKVRLIKVNNYVADTKVLLRQVVVYHGGLIIRRPEIYDIPDFPLVTDTTLYLIGFGNDSNRIYLEVKNRFNATDFDTTSSSIYVAKGDTSEINMMY